jgi:hypothetical protein
MIDRSIYLYIFRLSERNYLIKNISVFFNLDDVLSLFLGQDQK